MELGEKMKKLRLEQGLTLEEVGNRVGVGKSTVRKWENGQIANMRRDKIALVAKALNTTPGYLMGWEEPKPPHRPDFFPASAVRPLSDLHHQRVPMIGSVAAGEPIMGEELGVYVEAPVRCDAAVTVSGDSMEPTYKDGDVLYIRQQPEVLNGQVAVVFVDDLAAIKHVYREHDGVMLVSDNPAYPPMRYRFGDNADAINIFGIPIGFTRMFTR